MKLNNVILLKFNDLNSTIDRESKAFRIAWIKETLCKTRCKTSTEKYLKAITLGILQLIEDKNHS
jgi:hypothetical protein